MVWRRIARRLRVCSAVLGIALALLGIYSAKAAADSIDYLAEDAAAEERSGWGPLKYTTQDFFQSFRFSYLHTRPEPYPEGAVYAFTTLTWTNTFAYEKNKYLMQGETIQSQVYAAYGINQHWDVSLRLPVVWLTGGIMDPFIENFHHAFGLGDESRNVFPSNQVNMELRNPSGQVVQIADNNNKDLYARAPVASTRFHASMGPLPLTFTASVDVPQLASPAFYPMGNDSDWALGVATAVRFSERYFLTASIAYERERATLPYFVDHGVSTLLALNYRISDEYGAVLQAINESAIAQGSRSDLDNSYTEVQGGLQWIVKKKYRAEAAMVEKLSFANNTIDWGLHFAVSRFFGA